MPALRLVTAKATGLPFREATFDVTTASFVLSHLADYGAGLSEAYRVLKPSGHFAMTSWTANTDPYSEAWGQLLAEAVPKDRLEEAVAQVAPSEGYFEDAAHVESTLTRGHFSGVEVHTVALECDFSLDLYLADRELSSGARFACHALGPQAWGRFVENARDELDRRFGSHFSYSRGVLIGLGHRA